jgi:hypothetical protein
MIANLSCLRPAAPAALALSLAACSGGSPLQPTSVREAA